MKLIDTKIPYEIIKQCPLSITHKLEVKYFICESDNKAIRACYGSIWNGGEHINGFFAEELEEYALHHQAEIIKLNKQEYEQLKEKIFKWHGCTAKGPIDYLESSLRWANEQALDYLKEASMCNELTEDDLKDMDNLTIKLLNHLPNLMKDFEFFITKTLGFNY